MKTILKNTLLIAACLLIPHKIISAQESTFTITGVIVDARSNDPVPYATVALRGASTNKIITGTVTGTQGEFELKTTENQVLIEISFIGYETQKISKVLTESNLNIGTILLSPDAHQLHEVVVDGEKSTVEFKLDKRVFNVGKDLSSSGMGALDVLNNVPSVNVDIEGQISLRGSLGVQLLINGKPSVLADNQSNALGSITADMIESVEVITNPSAKYEAEGTSGIINIILKKEEKNGFNGSGSLNTGLPHNHSMGLSLNRRTDNFNFFTQLGGGYRSIPTTRESKNYYKIDSTTLLSSGEEFRNEAFYNFTIGTDYYINQNNIITLSGNYAYEFEDQPSETNYQRYQLQDTTSWKRKEVTTAGNPKWQFDLQYEKQFDNNEDHQFLLIAQGSFFGKELSSEFTNSSNDETPVEADQQTETNFHQANYIFKADYTNPFSDMFTLESGAAYEINDVGNEYTVYNMEDAISVPDPDLTNNFKYNQKVFGVYSTGAFEGDKWGIKLGLRAENTNLNTLLVTTNESTNQRYTEFFPSVHTSYKVSQRISFQAGYSRRTYRPRLWDLNPFFNIRDAYNIRRGNPNLKPEFADSYEVTGIVILSKASLNASVYHLYTTDVMERITTSESNVTITMPMNIGTNKRTGVSLNGKYTPAKWLTFNGDVNYGYFLREGNYEGQEINFNGDQWLGKFSGKVKVSSGTEVEITTNYHSDVRTVQGNNSGFTYADIGIRQKFWKGKLIVNASVSDVFESRKREQFVTESSYTNYSYSQRGRFVTLGVSYGIGKGEAMTYSGRRH